MSASSSLPLPQDVQARWPARLLEAQRALVSRSGEGIRRAALEEAWLLLHAAISRYLELHAARMGGVDREDLEDIAQDKALELARRLESEEWDPSGREPGEVAGFLSTVARNGLVDVFRHRGRHVERDEQEPADVAGFEEPRTERPETSVERRAFAESLCGCAGKLSARDRAVWFFRVFYELPSREIARHPEVRLKAPHVDVILQRCRKAVRECMAHQGYAPDDMPPGTFAELWEAFRLPTGSTRKESA